MRRPISAVLIAVASITPCSSFAQSVGGGGGGDRPTFVVQKDVGKPSGGPAFEDEHAALSAAAAGTIKPGNDGIMHASIKGVAVIIRPTPAAN